MQETSSRYRYLEPQRVIETIAALRERIEHRFPGSSLSQLVQELQSVSEQTVERSRWIRKPYIPLRVGVGLLLIIIPGLLFLMVSTLKEFRVIDISNFIQDLDAGISSIVFIGAAILFLVSWERRIKRNRAFGALHELRALAHIVDMHQLTKDPESHLKLKSQSATAFFGRTLTPYELGFYLSYCSEALALISKIAALYTQETHDSQLMAAVDDLDDLISGLSQKIWQKLTILETLTGPPKAGGPAGFE